MPIQKSLERAAELVPGKTAIVCEGARHTYSEVDLMTNRLARALLENGMEHGDRVVVYMPNSIETAVSIFGILKAGGSFVVINPTTKETKLNYIIRNSGASGIIADQSQQNTVSGSLRDSGSLRFAVLCGAKDDTATQIEGKSVLPYSMIQNQYPSTRTSVKTNDDDLACLLYTSGSTGEPKGVVEPHRSVDFVIDSIISYLKNVSEDVVIDCLPLSFDYGLYQLLMVVRFAGTLVLERAFVYPGNILRRMETEKVTGLPGVPTIFSVLTRMDLKRYDLSSLRYATNTADHLPTSVIQKLRNALPGVQIYSMYGLTECKRALYLPPEELERRPTSVGKAIPGTEVWLEDEHGNRLGPGSSGELIVRGPHVMRGYWNDPESTEKSFRPSPIQGMSELRTGDLFKMDEDGFLYFLARKDDIIKSGGEKVAPREIENVIYLIPGVREAAAVGIPDPVLGKAIKAVIVRDDPQLDERRVLQHCRKYLEDFMIPRVVEFRKELPRTPTGKISRRELGDSPSRSEDSQCTC